MTKPDTEDNWQIVCDTVDDVRAVKEFAYALMLLSETMDDGHRMVVGRIAQEILRCEQAIEEAQDKLCHALRSPRLGEPVPFHVVE